MHYYFYSKFNDRKDVDGNLRHQYQKFANSLYNIIDPHSILSLDNILKIIHNRNYEESSDFNIENVINKGLYAKFSQNEELKNILLSTEDSLLIQPTTRFSYKSDSYKIDYNLRAFIVI